MSTPPINEVEAPEEAAGHAPEFVRAVHDLVVVLMRTIKTMRLYDPRNPIYKKALRDMGERFRTHVAEHGGFALVVEQGRLQLGDEAIHTDDDPKEGIAFRLYSDGVRRITFRDGLTAEEVKVALELLARGTALKAGDDDDIVTLFWAADLPNIEVEAVEDEPPAFQLEPTLHDPQAADVEQAVRDAGQLAAQGQTQPVHFGQQALSVFVLGPKELNYIQGLVERESAQDPVQDLVGILSDVLSIEGEVDDFSETVDICAGLLVEFLSEGRFADADGLVRALGTALEAREEALGAPAREAVHEILDGLGEGGFLASLQDGLERVYPEPVPEGGQGPDRAHDRALKDLADYLARIDRTDPREVLRLAAPQPDPAVRDALCDMVARVCREERGPLLEMVLEVDPALVQCALKVVGRIGTPADLPRLASVSRNTDVNVRRAALEAVCRIAGGAHAQLYPYLTDADSRIRRRSLAMIEVSGFRQALDTLMALVPRPVFATWEMNERRAVFNTIGVLGGDDVLGFFQSHLGRKGFSLFGGRKDEDLSLCAVAGLKAAGTDAARAILEQHARKGSRKVRSACEWALREMGTGL
jgi:hypothetical protein